MVKDPGDFSRPPQFSFVPRPFRVSSMAVLKGDWFSRNFGDRTSGDLDCFQIVNRQS
jgi:hypothetical protein